MSTDAPAESDSAPRDAENSIVFPSQDAGETFIRTLLNSPYFCEWCLCPLAVNPRVQFHPEGPKDTLETGDSYRAFGGVERNVPPDRTDSHGRVVETSKTPTTICRDCGVIDTSPGESRTNETVRQALRHVVSILQENDVEVSRPVADETVSEAFAQGHTGRFVATLGRAVFEATE